MVLTSAQYHEILRLLIHIGCDHRTLEQLKGEFRDEINSQRVFERIQSLPSLFSILERRVVLGPEMVENLCQIINRISPRNVEIQNILFAREPNIVLPPVQNHIAYNNDDQRRVLPPVPPNSVEKINHLVKTSIGAKWKELARALNIQEGHIDQLQYKYRDDIYRMVHEILTVLQERCGTNYELWRSRLQQALTRARRRDLSEDIDDILRFITVSSDKRQTEFIKNCVP